MARKKVVKASADAGEKDAGAKAAAPADAVIKHGIWGLIYASTGVLLLISMLFYSPAQFTDAQSTHVLGPYLGTSLAYGMFYLFGRITAFMFPAAVCYIGIAKLTVRPLRSKLLLFLAALTLEACLILAVNHLPALNAGGLAATAAKVQSNYIGLFMANALVPLFKGRVFGPYFITAVLMAITVMVGLRVRPQAAAAAVSKWFIAVLAGIKRAFTEVKIGIENSPDIVNEKGPLPESSEDKPVDDDKKAPADDKKASSKKREKKSSADAPPPEAGSGDAANAEDGNSPAPTDAPAGDVNTNAANDSESAERKLTPEEELERIRKRVKIGSMETAEVEPVLEDAVIPNYTGDENGDTSAESSTDTGGDISSGVELGSGDADANAGNEGDDGDDLYSDDDIDVNIKVNVFSTPSKPYVPPPPDVLPEPPPLSGMTDEDSIYRNSAILEKTLKSFGINGEVNHVSPGPVVTRYEIALEAGTKVSRVENLQKDISLAVGGLQVRIQAPIPGKAAIGVELPNEKRQNIYFKRILTSDVFKKSVATADIPVVIGSNISGGECVTDIAKTPHLLIAGTTGSGKSVCMNSLICSMLMTRTPEELRLIMIDPKVVEMASFADIPHLLAPVVTEPKEAVKALQWGVNEMERRYKLLGKSGAKKLETFNTRVKNGELADILDEEENKPLPLIVIIIDELADLMMTASKDVEGLIMRITQKARAAGIHLIVATQRPSVDIVTGKIKSNLPSRIGFRTVQAVDSRTILDRVGAEKLLGLGDMLFLRNGAPDIERYHGAFISEEEVEAIVGDIKAQGVETEKIESFNDVITDEEEGEGGGGGDFDDGKRDAMFADAAQLVVSTGLGSTSLLQRRLGMGFARAGRVMDQLERAGVVGPSKGSKAREVLMMAEDLADII